MTTYSADCLGGAKDSYRNTAPFKVDADYRSCPYSYWTEAICLSAFYPSLSRTEWMTLWSGSGKLSSADGSYDNEDGRECGGVG